MKKPIKSAELGDRQASPNSPPDPRGSFAQLLIFGGVVLVALFLSVSFRRHAASDTATDWVAVSSPVEGALLIGTLLLMGSVAAFAGRLWRGALAVVALSGLGGLGAFLVHDNVPAGLLGWLVGTFLMTRYAVRLFHWGFRFLAALVFGAMVGGVSLYLWERSETWIRYPYAGGALLAGLAAAFFLIQQLQRPDAREAHYGLRRLWRFLNQATLLALVMGGVALSYTQPLWVNWKSDQLPETVELRSKLSEMDVSEAARFSLRVRRLLDEPTSD